MADDTNDAPARGAPDDGTDDDGMNTDAGRRALRAERDRVKALEAQLAELKPLAEQAKKAEDEQKTEVQRLTEQVEALKRDRDTATVERDRLKVALGKGLTLTQAKRLVGSTEEELAADADELLADLGATKENGSDKPVPAGKPREHLKPGTGDPDQPVEETDLKKIGERMFAR